MAITAEDIIDTLDDVNMCFTRIADPEVLATTVRMLEAMAPFVNSAGPDAHAAYIAAKKRLGDPMQPLVNPRTGIQFQV
jgi:hypothetical protein